MDKKVTKIIVSLILSIVSIGCFCGAFYFIYFENYFNSVNLESIQIVSYKSNTKMVTFKVESDVDEKYCSFGNENLNPDSLEFLDMNYNTCTFEVPLGTYYSYFKNKFGVISNPVLIDNYVYKIELKDKYYLAVGDSIDLEDGFYQIGEADISFENSNADIVHFKKFLMTGKKAGETKIKVKVNEDTMAEFSVVVTNAITKMPKKFNLKKPYLPCKAYSTNDAKLLDKILEDRINVAGYKTRAGAVAAARFLTLEFPYRITYFFENGRVHPHDGNYADGEGRYYHKGLYLSEDKFDTISGSFAGPAIWGCPLKNFESTNLFKYGRKYPNGLDCSGFVSWVLYNAGFDVKDIGAGESTWPYELTDLGDFQSLTLDLVYSNKIKVGDLINDWGHIAIIVGIAEDNFYVAESLDIYGGVVLRSYPKKKVRDTFTYVVLMDELYLKDGNLTDMWF